MVEDKDSWGDEAKGEAKEILRERIWPIVAGYEDEDKGLWVKECGQPPQSENDPQSIASEETEMLTLQLQGTESSH